MTRARVLVVDDKENILKLFTKILGETYDVVTAADAARALLLVGSQPFDVVVSDIRMPGADGHELLRAVKARSPDTELVLMTGYATIESAVQAMKDGAFEYLQKPFDPDVAARVVQSAVERRRQRMQATDLRGGVAGAATFANIIGTSEPMREVYALLARAAEMDITVLVTGESGTGKELAARALHEQGARRGKPFIPVNAGALPSELVESELFGHGRGAFTGATAAKRGLFEEANGGTLFLDEIGDLPLPVQVKLNRALQEREIRRVGENTPIKIDVRIVAATHHDLRADARAGLFREDLFYRLNVFPVRLPPLRERRDDIPLLVAHFLEKHATAHRRDVRGLQPEALRLVTSYAWPGNVRELENVLERAVAVANGPLVTPADLPPELRAAPAGLLPAEMLVKLPYREVVEFARESVTREYLAALLREFHGNVTRAAERAGVERESLHRLLKKHGLRSDDFKA